MSCAPGTYSFPSGSMKSCCVSTSQKMIGRFMSLLRTCRRRARGSGEPPLAHAKLLRRRVRHLAHHVCMSVAGVAHGELHPGESERLLPREILDAAHVLSEPRVHVG